MVMMQQRVNDDAGRLLQRPVRAAAGADQAFSPKTLPGMVLWLDASRLTELADNDPISQWDDASGLDHHATSTGANRPKYKNVGVKGLPTVNFDGADDWFLLPALNGSASPLSIYAIITPSGSGSRRLLDVQTGRLYFYWRSSGGQTGVFNNSADRDCAAVATGSQLLTWICSAGSGITFRRDGVDIANAHAFVQTALAGTIRIGAHYDGSSSRYLGDLSELLIYAAEHTTPQAESVEGYLSTKYFG